MSKIESFRATLEDFIPAETLGKYVIENIASTPVEVFRLPVNDRKSTYIYNFSPDVCLRSEELLATYNLVESEALKLIIDKLKVGRINDKDYWQDTEDPYLVTFPYQYNPRDQLKVMLLPDWNTLARHMLFISDHGLVPKWAEQVSGTTKTFDNIPISVINVSRINKRKHSNPKVYLQDLNYYPIVEIFQQMILVGSVIQGREMYPLTHPLSKISQEGVCNGLALAAVGKKLNKSWHDVEKELAKEYPKPAPSTLPNSLKLFKVNRPTYKFLPDKSLLVLPN